MSALDLITLKDYKDWSPAAGPAKDAVFARTITAASWMIEQDLGRRLRFRCPPEANLIVAEIALANGALTIAQPNSAGRYLGYKVTGDADFGVIGGLITATGTFDGVAGATEVIDLANGAGQWGTKVCTALTSIVVSALSGAGAGDKVKVEQSQGHVEYHAPSSQWDSWRALPLIEWPVLSINEVNEDASHAWTTTTRLVAGTDYRVTRLPEGDVLVRLSSALKTFWQAGERSTRVILSAGYTVAMVPEQVKEVCRQLAKSLYTQNADGRGPEVANWSNALGSGSRFAAAKLTKEQRRQLDPYRRNRFGTDTGERDFDLEAA